MQWFTYMATRPDKHYPLDSEINGLGNQRTRKSTDSEINGLGNQPTRKSMDSEINGLGNQRARQKLAYSEAGARKSEKLLIHKI